MKRTLLLLSVALLSILAANAQDSTAKKEYVGKYKFPEGSVVPEVDVVIENGVLMMNSSAGTSTLELIKADTFSLITFNGTVIFKRSDSKKVVGVHIDAGGYILDGVKDSTVSKYAFIRMENDPVIINTAILEEKVNDYPNKEALFENTRRRKIV